jgi:hypothetical protein
MTTLKPVPSPRGTNNERLFFLPAGISPTAAAAALDAALKSPMALDALPRSLSRRRRLTRDDTGGYARADEGPDRLEDAAVELERLFEGRLEGHEVEHAKSLLRVIKAAAEKTEAAEAKAARHLREKLGAEEEGEAEDEEGESEGMSDEDARAYHRAIALLRETRPGAIPAFQATVRDRFGALPRNAAEGGIGGRVHDQAKRQREDQRARVAFDERFPDAARIDGAAVESFFGAQPNSSFEPISEGTMQRWGEANRIKHT